jgi:2-dehydropantoate 2-reductase
MIPEKDPTLFHNIAIVGAGALGSYYGARLALGGHAVHFLMRSDYTHVKQNGLRIQSPDGDFNLPAGEIHVYDDPGRMPKMDLVIVTLKTTANRHFKAMISPLLHEKTAILTLQNGLGTDGELANLFGASRVLGGLAFICTNRIEPGIVQHTGYGFIKLGEFHPGLTARSAAMAAMFNAVKVRCEAMEDIRVGQWEKLVWNVPFNGLGAAMDLTTDGLLASETGRGLVRGVMEEVMATARAVGVNLPADTPQKQIDRTPPMGAYITSMQVDRRARRPLEHEAIIGRPLAVARDAGVKSPIMQVLYDQLVTIDSVHH